MKRWATLIAVIIFWSLASFTAVAQRKTRGIVIDSASLKALAGVHVRLKGSNHVAVTDRSGVFTLTTTLADTLLFTMVGYSNLELPLFLEEEDLMIRMSEKFQLLKEVTITGNRLYESQIIRSERRVPHKMSTADAFSSPWEYFSRGQKDKRKVVKLITENNRIKTYVQVINDQELREDIMFDHDITEVEYYNTLAKFNAQSSDVLYVTDPTIIIASLRSFFKTVYR